MCEHKVCFKAKTCNRQCAHKMAHAKTRACNNRYCPDVGMNICVASSIGARA